MTVPECEEFLASDLLSHFAFDAGSDNEDEDEDQFGSMMSAGSTNYASEITALEGEINQLKEYGVFLPHVSPSKTGDMEPSPSMFTTGRESGAPLTFCFDAKPLMVAKQTMTTSVPADKRDAKDVLAWADEVLAAEPRNHYIYLERAKTHFKLGNFDAARADGLRCTELDTTFERGYAWIGNVLLKMGNFSEAHEQLTQMKAPLELDVLLLGEKWKSAQREFKAAKYTDCVESLQDVVYHTTHSAEIKGVFVDACIKTGRWPLIVECLAEWLSQPPFSMDTQWRYKCAMSYFHAAQYNECLKMLDSDETLEAAGPGSAAAKEWRQKCASIRVLIDEVQDHLKTEQYASAHARLEEASTKFEGDGTFMKQLLHAWRAKVYSEQGNTDGVLSECSLALEGNTCRWTTMPLSLRAKCYVGLQENALAIEDYERLLKIHPEDGKARRELQRLRDIIPDLYLILKMKPDATVKQLNGSYRKLVLHYHPDRQFGQTDEERRRTKVKFHELYETFMLLSDPAKRLEYDEYLGLEAADLAPGPSALQISVVGLAFAGIGYLCIFGQQSLRRYVIPAFGYLHQFYSQGGIRISFGNRHR